MVDCKTIFAALRIILKYRTSESENIKLLIGRNNLNNSVYVGDTIWDYEAAQKANVPIYATMVLDKLIILPERLTTL